MNMNVNDDNPKKPSSSSNTENPYSGFSGNTPYSPQHPPYGNPNERKQEPPRQEYITPPQYNNTTTTNTSFQPEQPQDVYQDTSNGPSDTNPYPDSFSQNAQSPYSGSFSQNAQSPYSGGGSPSGSGNRASYGGPSSTDPYGQNMQYANGQAEPPYPYSMNGTNGQTNTVPIKKRSHKWVWGLAAIPALALIAVLAFFLIPSFKVFVLRNALGTTKYYEYVEAKCNEQSFQLFGGLDLAKQQDALKKGVGSNTSLAFHLDSDFVNKAGFDINKLSCDITSSCKDTKAQTSCLLNYDGKHLVTLDLYTDSNGNKVYFKIPELSGQYLNLKTLLETYSSANAASKLPSGLSSSGLLSLSTGSSLTGITECASTDSDAYTQIIEKLREKLDAKTMQELLTTYVRYIIDDLGDKGAIKLKKGADYTIENTTESCDEFTIFLTSKELKEVALDTLKKAKDDKKLQEIVTDVTGISSLYTASVNSLISELEAADPSYDLTLSMNVYTDGNVILGRQFLISSGINSFSFDYGTIQTASKLAATASIKSDSQPQASITIDADKADGAYSGNAVISLSDKNITVDYKDYSYDSKENKINGSFTFSFDGATITADMANKDKKNELTLGATIQGVNYGTCTITSEALPADSVSIEDIKDSDVIPITTSEELAQYLENSNLDSFLQSLITTLNLPSTTSAKDLADAIISGIRSGSGISDGLPSGSGSGEDYNEPNASPDTPATAAPEENNDSEDSPYKAEDYNLPSGTKIDKDGYYGYEISKDELNRLKDKFANDKAFNKGKDELTSFSANLASTLFSSKPETMTTNNNRICGNVKENFQTISHTMELEWYDTVNTDYVVLAYDTLSEKVTSFTVSASNKDKIYSALTDAYKALGCKEPSSKLLQSIQDSIKNDKDLNISEYFSDNSLYLTSRTQNENEHSYYFTISADTIG